MDHPLAVLMKLYSAVKKKLVNIRLNRSHLKYADEIFLKSEVAIASLFRQTKQPDIFLLEVKTITKSQGLLSLSNLAIYNKKAELWF
jgi:hypothetical protein